MNCWKSLSIERRVELAFEGLRLFDLYRWKELDKAVANIENERTMYGLAYEARKFNGERGMYGLANCRTGY